jgi:hypothetical protein
MVKDAIKYKVEITSNANKQTDVKQILIKL